MILAIDPDTTATGWAYGDLHGPRAVGAVKPRNRLDLPWVRAWDMAQQVYSLKTFDWASISHVVIEMPGRQGPPNRQGQAMYGVAPGVFYCRFRPFNAVGVPVHEWTRGQPKDKRAEMMRQAYPVYERVSGLDRGKHMADAVGLLVWWCAEQLAHV